MHYKNFGFGDTTAEETERAGYLPVKTEEERKMILSTTSGSIDYIGAILRADTDVLSKAGYDISNDPAMLTLFYHGWELEDIIEHFKNKRYPDPLSIGDDEMANWVSTHLDFS